MERNRISSLQSHGKALEKECCLPGVFCDSGDTPANDRTAVKSRLHYEQIRVCPRGTADMRVNNDDGHTMDGRTGLCAVWTALNTGQSFWRRHSRDICCSGR